MKTKEFIFGWLLSAIILWPCLLYWALNGFTKESDIHHKFHLWYFKKFLEENN